MLPELTPWIMGAMVTGGLTMCVMLCVALLWPQDRDAAIVMMPLPFLGVAVTLAMLQRFTPAIAILSVLTLIRLRGYLLKRWGNYTLACLLFRQHEWCKDHLKCECPHHDKYIHREMAK